MQLAPNLFSVCLSSILLERFSGMEAGTAWLSPPPFIKKYLEPGEICFVCLCAYKLQGIACHLDLKRQGVEVQLPVLRAACDRSHARFSQLRHVGGHGQAKLIFSRFL